jgi:hypothetical protein
VSPAFIALSAAASAYIESRKLQDAAEHLHRIRMLARAPDSVIREAAAEWSRASVEATNNYHELARCAEIAAAAIKAAEIPQPESPRLPLAVEMAQCARQAEMLRQFERDCE